MNKRQELGSDLTRSGARSKEDRKRDIIQSARALFRIKPLDEVTTQEIAYRARVGEATLFRHIGTKNHLLSLVYADELDSVLDDIDKQDLNIIKQLPAEMNLSSQAIYRVLCIYEKRSEFFSKNPVNGARYLLEGFQLSGPDWRRNMAQGDHSIRMVSGILHEAQTAGALLNTVDSGLVAENVHATYMHEIYRGPAREYEPSTLWHRLEPRLQAQLAPLVRRATSA